MQRLSSVVFAVLASAPAAFAQFPVLVMQEGDVVQGVGAAVAFDEFDVNDKGRWVATVVTDVLNPFTDEVIVRDGVPLWREGDPIVEPAGAFLDDLGTPRIDDENRVIAIWGLSGAVTPADDEGLYCNGQLLIRKGDVSTAAGFTPGTRYLDLHRAHTSEVDTILLVATVDDPAIPGPARTALVVVEHDGAGNVVTETVHLRVGDTPGGTTESILEIATDRKGIAFASNGRVAARVRLTGPEDTDYAVLVDGTVVAREGSPTGGSMTWVYLNHAVIDVNALGITSVYGFASFANGSLSRFAIGTPSRRVMSVGEQHPGHGHFEYFESLGGGHAPISDGGEVVYYGRSQGPMGLFTSYEFELSGLMSARTTEPGGFDLSSSGRFLGLIGATSSGQRVIARMDRAVQDVDFCIGEFNFGYSNGLSPIGCPCNNNGHDGNREGCRNSQGHGAILDISGSREVAVGDTRFHLSQARPNQPAMLLQGSTFAPMHFRDGAFCLGNPTIRVTTFVTDAAGAGHTTVDVAAVTGSQPGDWPYYQIWYRDPAISPCGTGSNFSQGVRVLWK